MNICHAILKKFAQSFAWVIVALLLGVWLMVERLRRNRNRYRAKRAVEEQVRQLLKETRNG